MTPQTSLTQLLAMFKAVRPTISERAKMALELDDWRGLTALAMDKGEVRMRVAANRYAPPGLLRILAGDRLSCVRAQVARNTRTPLDVLQRLMQDPTPRVIQSAIRNPRIRRDQNE